jgi:phosphoribosyl 1,2-cyclic phosphodiesterase
MARVRLRFLGTGASGGTPGHGRSRRRESSLLADSGTALLLDVTRHFREQSRLLDRIDAVLLTHAHRDAIGGLAALRTWWREHADVPIPVFASRGTLAVVTELFARLDHCRLVAVDELQQVSCDGWVATPVGVPHAPGSRYPTFAWRLETDLTTVVYASDVARLTPPLERLSAGASLLIVDGAMWGRSLFSHLRADRALPELCDWDVRQILLTQIGRSAPAHAELEHEVRSLCAKAAPAYDGLEVVLG